ncbi:MAG: hypothetical protein JXB32_15300 [Deltaproteobacteria bacterium]|nr:hypothetical protein [Deltaproteobacteria bacterium]
MTGTSRSVPPVPPARSGWRRAAPWVLASVCAAAAAVAWWTRPAVVTGGDPAEPGGEGADPDSAEVRVEPAPGLARDSAALKRCVVRLEAARALLERCENDAAAAVAPAEPPAPELPALQADCLAEPEVRAELERRVREEVERTMQLEATRREEARAARDDTARRMLEQSLGLNTVESAWVRDFVCAARGQRHTAVEEVIAGREAPLEAWRKLRRERQEVLQDLAAYLGRDRVAKLRQLGGIGLVADSIQCEEEPR